MKENDYTIHVVKDQSDIDTLYNHWVNGNALAIDYANSNIKLVEILQSRIYQAICNAERIQTRSWNWHDD
jgi:hypothetical protein